MKLSHVLAAGSLMLGAVAPALAQPAMVAHRTVVTHRTVVVRHHGQAERHCRTIYRDHHRITRCSR